MNQSKTERIKDIISRGVTDVIVRQSLEKSLKGGSKLRVKLGIDPTHPTLHIGRAVSLLKLRALQELGHKLIFIIGDYTAQLGDPSDKEKERPMLTETQALENMRLYEKQAGLIIDIDNTEVRYNSEWHNNLTQKETIALASKFTVSQMTERDNFSKRLKANKPVWLHELLYPQLQGYDSVMVKADLEIGGNDQLFNLMAGREIQRMYKQKPQDVLTTELIEGTDGRKMSASHGNAVWLNDSSKEMYGKLMSINDGLIVKYLRLCTVLPSKEIKLVEKELTSGSNPRDAKMLLAHTVTEFYHGAKAAVKAAQGFSNVFSKGQLPTDMVEAKVTKKKATLVDLITETKLTASRSEARRLIEQGGVKIDGTTIHDWRREVQPKNGMVLQIGRRRFVKIKLK